jgi:hypothetical protein
LDQLELRALIGKAGKEAMVLRPRQKKQRRNRRLGELERLDQAQRVIFDAADAAGKNAIGVNGEVHKFNSLRKGRSPNAQGNREGAKSAKTDAKGLP